jgi:serine protease Do
MDSIRSVRSPSRLGRIAAAGLLSLGMAALAGGNAQARGPESLSDLAEQLIDSVVNISTSQNVAAQRAVPTPEAQPGSPFEEFFEDFFNKRGGEGRPRRVSSLGSGFVLDAAGVVITNNHVIESADEIVVNFNDGSKLVAELVGKDPKTDLAVLRVKPTKPLKAVGFGDSDKLRVGDWVMAIGNPFGLGGTVTAGIVSARNRDINSGPYDNYIQTDAAINRGNSGGPLFDMNGAVVGINTAIISPTGGSIGIGFAIPAANARGVVDQLLQFGETRRGWLGVRIQQVTDDIAESLKLGEPRGALIAGVNSDGPAQKAGIEPGDVVLSFDGKPIKEMRDLPRFVADTPIGKEVDIVVLRKGEQQTKRVVVARLIEEEPKKASLTPDAKTEEVAKLALGLTLSTLTDELKKKHGITGDLKGVVVTEVDPKSAAADKQIQVGDMILEVGQETVTTPADISARIEALKKEGRKTALFQVANPKGEIRFVALSLE